MTDRFTANLDALCVRFKDQDALPMQQGVHAGALVTVRCVLQRTAVISPPGNEDCLARSVVLREKVLVDPDEYLFSRDERAIERKQSRRRGQASGGRRTAARKAG